MFIRATAGNHIINLDNVVEIEVMPEVEPAAYWDEEYQERRFTRYSPLTLNILTTAVRDPGEEISPDYSNAVTPRPYSIRLSGTEADEFLGALTVYGPLGRGEAGGGA